MEKVLSAIEIACRVVGGQAEMARLLEVTPPAVNQWCKRKREVPSDRCPDIERETGKRGQRVKCEQLRPDIAWGVLRTPSSELPTAKATSPKKADRARTVPRASPAACAAQAGARLAQEPSTKHQSPTGMENK